jgi:hypothetical protein
MSGMKRASSEVDRTRVACSAGHRTPHVESFDSGMAIAYSPIMAHFRDVEIRQSEVNALASAAWRARARGGEDYDALVSLLRQLAPGHEVLARMDALARRAGYPQAGADEHFGDERFGAPSEVSELPCRCGERHRLGEFAPGSQVVYAQQVRPRTASYATSGRGRMVAIGEQGRVVEWSQYGGSLYYRVELSDGERDNFCPCELRSIS